MISMEANILKFLLSLIYLFFVSYALLSYIKTHSLIYPHKDVFCFFLKIYLLERERETEKERVQRGAKGENLQVDSPECRA